MSQFHGSSFLTGMDERYPSVSGPSAANYGLGGFSHDESDHRFFLISVKYLTL